MIIVDKGVNNKLEISLMFNKTSEFKKAINFIKSNSNYEYDPDNKVWRVNKDKSFLDNLTDKFDTSFKRSYYELLDIEPPKIFTPPRLIQKEYGSLKDYYNKFDYGKVKDFLFDFQKVGVISGLYTLNKKQGFLLCDDVGLGKTAEAIGIIQALRNKNKVNKVIIFSPKNVKYQWGDEIDKFTHDLTFTVVDSYNKEKRLEKFDEESDIYIVNHDQIIIDEDYNKIKELDCDMCVIDEIHSYKNNDAQRTQAMKNIKDIWKYKVGLTATPIANDLTDLYNILDIVIPGYLGEWKEFSKKHVEYYYDTRRNRAIPVGYKNLFEVKKKKAMVSIQRKREEVEDDMPKVKTKYHKLDITPQQRNIHEEISELISNKRLKLETTDSDREINEIEESIQGLMTLQIGVADSPLVLERSDNNYVRRLANKYITNNSEVQSAKTEYIRELVNNILNYNDRFKIIIFSRFSTMVNIVIENLYELDIINNIAHIDGSLDEKTRYKEMKKFKEEEDTRVIVTTDAGNEGVNLQRASHLINVDLPWNPKTLIQRNGRMVRIGSPWDTVYISNLVSQNTIEERIMQVLDRKNKLIESAINNTNEQKEFFKEITKMIS